MSTLRSRSRTYGQNKDKPYLTIVYNRSGSVTKETYGSCGDDVTEQMTDYVGYTFNPVSHTKVEYDDGGFTLGPAYNSHPRCITTFVYGRGLRPFGIAKYFAEPDYSTPHIALIQDAMGNMSDNVNMVVNVAEASQIKQIVPQIIKIGRNLIRKGHGMKRLKDLANGHLLYAFGIAPLYRDLTKFFNIHDEIMKRRQELRDRNLKTVRISKRQVTTLDVTVPIGKLSSASDWICENAVNESWAKCATVVSANCTAFYNLDHPGTNWKLVSQALGLTTPLQSTWELIPFSFVFDWFLPVGKALKEVERRGLSLVEESAVTRAFVLTDYCTSVKHTVVECPRGSVTSSPWWPAVVGTKLLFNTRRTSSYVRNPGHIPGLSYWSPGSDWTMSQTALSLSLSVQRVGSTHKPGPKKWPSLEQIHVKPQVFRKR